MSVKLFFRYLLWAMALVLLVMLVAWLSFPFWARWSLNQLLPAPARMEQLELSRPGLSRLTVPKFSLSFGNITLKGESLNQEYWARQSHIEQVQLIFHQSDQPASFDRQALTRGLRTMLRQTPDFLNQWLATPYQGQINQLAIHLPEGTITLHRLIWHSAPETGTLDFCLAPTPTDKACFSLKITRHNNGFRIEARNLLRPSLDGLDTGPSTSAPWLELTLATDHWALHRLQLPATVQQLVSMFDLPEPLLHSKWQAGLGTTNEKGSAVFVELGADLTAGSHQLTAWAAPWMKRSASSPLSNPLPASGTLPQSAEGQLSVPKPGAFQQLAENLETHIHLKLMLPDMAKRLPELTIKANVSLSLRQAGPETHAPEGQSSRSMNASLGSLITFNDALTAAEIKDLSLNLQVPPFQWPITLGGDTSGPDSASRKPMLLSGSSLTRAQVRLSEPLPLRLTPTGVTLTDDKAPLQWVVQAEGATQIQEGNEGPSVAFQWQLQGHPTITPETHSLTQVKALEVDIQALNLTHETRHATGEIQLVFDRLSSDLTDINGHWQTRLTLSPEANSPPLNLISRGTITPATKPGRHQLNGQLQWGQLPPLPLQGFWQSDTHQLAIELEKTWPAPEAEALLQKLLVYSGQSKSKLAITAGEVKLKTHIRFDQQWHLQAALNTQALALSIDDHQITGINARQQLDWPTEDLAQGSMEIDEIHLGSGLRLADTQFDYQFLWQDSQLQLNHLKSRLFDGELTVEQLVVTPEGLQPTQVELRAIELNQLVKFLDIEGLQAEGKLDATIPLRTQAGSLLVEQGHFKARDKGRIQYDTGRPLGEQDLALLAVKNFHYTQLDGQFDYLADGSYPMQLHLQGANPDLYNGYPIDFKVNIKGSLPGAFRALFLTGDFENAVTEMAAEKP